MKRIKGYYYLVIFLTTSLFIMMSFNSIIATNTDPRTDQIPQTIPTDPTNTDTRTYTGDDPGFEPFLFIGTLITFGIIIIYRFHYLSKKRLSV